MSDASRLWLAAFALVLLLTAEPGSARAADTAGLHLVALQDSTVVDTTVAPPPRRPRPRVSTTPT